MATKYTDSDLLRAMVMHNDFDSVVYGMNGHYGIRASYQELDSYGKSNDVSNTDAAKGWKTDCGDLDENLQNAHWMSWL